jgi:hypothetical protein
MLAIRSGPPDGSPDRSTNESLDDVLETVELTLEAIDDLRVRIDEATRIRPAVDERPDRLLAEVDRLHRRVEEIAEASWRRSEDDRVQGALDAIDRLRIRVDEADPSESVLRTLDLVSDVAARLDADDGRALTELTLEAVEDLRSRVGQGSESARSAIDRAVAQMELLRREVEVRDPAEGIELSLEAIDDIGRRVDARAGAIESTVLVQGRAVDGRLAAIESALGSLAAMAAELRGAVAELSAFAAAPAPLATARLEDAVIAAIADRVAVALTAPPGDHNAAVVASAAAAMSRLEGRLDSEFGSVERNVDRMERHLSELETLVRGTIEPEQPSPNGSERAADAGSGLLARFRPRGRAARR